MTEVKNDRRGKKPKSPIKAFFYGLITGALLILVALGSAFYLGAFTALHSFLNQKDEGVITEAYIAGRLVDASELVTAKYIYSGVHDYKDGDNLLNKSEFSMFYAGTVRAGIDDVSLISSEITSDTVTINLPASRVIDVHIDPKSLRFFDIKEGIIHSESHAQTADSLKQAEENVRTADMSELLDLADEQLDNVMKGLFEDVIGDRELIINHEMRTDSTAQRAVID